MPISAMIPSLRFFSMIRSSNQQDHPEHRQLQLGSDRAEILNLKELLH